MLHSVLCCYVVVFVTCENYVQILPKFPYPTHLRFLSFFKSSARRVRKFATSWLVNGKQCVGVKLPAPPTLLAPRFEVRQN